MKNLNPLQNYTYVKMMVLIQDHWKKNRIIFFFLIRVYFSSSILKMSMEWFSCTFRNEIDRHGFSHTATLYTKMRIAERSFPKKVTFILYSLKSWKSFLIHLRRLSPASPPEEVKGMASICSCIELQTQDLSMTKWLLSRLSLLCSW